jgi:nucleotide-binding universal stress UspA family protein
MPKILVPVDFSPTSINAAIYAAHFGKAIGASQVSFLSVVSDSIVGDDGTPISGGIDDRNFAIIQKLEELQVHVYEMTGVPTAIELQTGEFSELVPTYLEKHEFDFMVIGVTGSVALEQVFGTSHAVQVIAHTATPVLVVPPEANFNTVKNLALTVELHHTDDIIPLEDLNRWLHWLNPKVYIAHVNKSATEQITEDERQELERLKDKLILFQPEESLLKGESFSGVLNEMAVEKSIDLLVTFPQKHNFFNLLFRTTHTRSLVFHSKVPVLALPHK